MKDLQENQESKEILEVQGKNRTFFLLFFLIQHPVFISFGCFRNCDFTDDLKQRILDCKFVSLIHFSKVQEFVDNSNCRVFYLNLLFFSPQYSTKLLLFLRCLWIWIWRDRLNIFHYRRQQRIAIDDFGACHYYVTILIFLFTHPAKSG